ncbi:MAG: hypothetical protein ACLU0O_11320 [Collinsella sp.]
MGADRLNREAIDLFMACDIDADDVPALCGGAADYCVRCLRPAWMTTRRWWRSSIPRVICRRVRTRAPLRVTLRT